MYTHLYIHDGEITGGTFQTPTNITVGGVEYAFTGVNYNPDGTIYMGTLAELNQVEKTTLEKARHESILAYSF